MTIFIYSFQTTKMMTCALLGRQQLWQKSFLCDVSLYQQVHRILCNWADGLPSIHVWILGSLPETTAQNIDMFIIQWDMSRTQLWLWQQCMCHWQGPMCSLGSLTIALATIGALYYCQICVWIWYCGGLYSHGMPANHHAYGYCKNEDVHLVMRLCWPSVASSRPELPSVALNMLLNAQWWRWTHCVELWWKRIHSFTALGAAGTYQLANCLFRDVRWMMRPLA